MKKRIILIIFVLIVLISGLFVGSYIIRKNKYQNTLSARELENSENIIEKDTPTTTEYGTIESNDIADSETPEGIGGHTETDSIDSIDIQDEISEESKAVIERLFGDDAEYNVDEDENGDGSGFYGEPAAKLPEEYEKAMEGSPLKPFEKELIRLMVEKENRTFEEALKEVRPDMRIIEYPIENPVEPPVTETEAETGGEDIEPTTPVEQQTPTTNSGSNQGSSSTPDYSGGGYTEEQRQRDLEALEECNGGVGEGNMTEEDLRGIPDAFGN